MDTKILYIPLLDEGTDVFRPTKGKMIADLIFRVLSTEGYDPNDENWAFPPGSIVKCENRIIGGKLVLVAKEKL
ncbi:MAG: hypothetical protein WCK35_10955 [Chloroflexota bacterium]